MNKIRKKFIQIIIGFIILFLLFKAVGIGDFLNVLKTINLFWLIPSFLMTIPIQLMATINLEIMLKAVKKNIPFGYLFKAMTLTQSISMVAPGKLGDFSLIFFLKNKGVGYGMGLAIAILDKIITFFILSIIALIGIFWFLNLKLFLAVFIICALIIFMAMYAISSNKIRELIKRHVLRKYADYFKGFSKNFEYIINKRRGYIMLNIIVTAIKWTTSFLSLWFIFKAFNQSIAGYYIIFVSAIINIIALIPISFSGLGLREGSGTYLYHILTGVDTALSMNVMIIATVRKYIIALFYYLINLDLLDVKKRKKVKSK